MTPNVAPLRPAEQSEQDALPPAGSQGSGSGFNPLKPRTAGTVKEAVMQAFDAAGGKDAVMALLQVNKTRYYAVTDEGEDRYHLHFREAAALSAAGVPDLVSYLAALAGGMYVPLPDRRDDEGFADMTAETAHRHGQFMATMARALRDGRVDEHERLAALPQAKALAHAASAILGRLMKPIEERQ